MYPVRRSTACSFQAILLASLAWVAPALAQGAQQPPGDEWLSRWWVSAGLGSAVVQSGKPAPSAGRSGLSASVDVGYRHNAEWGLGFEYALVAPLAGCTVWDCAASLGDFAPNFTRLMAFAEYRPQPSGWRFRAGTGVSRFCYQRHWSESAWGWGDALELVISGLLDDDYVDDPASRSGAWRCDGRAKALGAMVSLGYDWRVHRSSPLSMGWRLTAEAANFDRTPAIGLPAFRHRAVMLSLQLNIN